MKYLKLPCPTCEFPHDFKRICWWEADGVYIGLYGSDDMKSRKQCRQELIHGVGNYEDTSAFMQKAFDAHIEPKDAPTVEGDQKCSS